jgi:hypothetical protein
LQAFRLVGGSDAVLVIDDTAIAKKGTHSVGVAAQYASALGKTANCQTLVSLTLARGEVPVTLALRLFLPESWTSKRARLERAGVPAEYRTARTKPEMALAEIDRAIAAGVRFGCVLADAGYGLSAPFRQGLTARKLAWAVGIPRHLKVYPDSQGSMSILTEPRDEPRLLFDHLVGAGDERRRHVEAERLGGLEIDDELEVGRRLNGQVGGFVALEDTIGIRRRTPKLTERVNSVGQQPADFSEETGPIDGRDTVASSQQSNLRAMADREGIRYHDQATIRLACLCGNN